MKIKNKMIGIWGFGVVGKSAAKFCANQGSTIIVWDDNPLSDCPYQKASSLRHLFKTADHIIPSPGVDISDYYSDYKNKWIFELDIFHHYFKKKIIAITGTVGKTTVASILEKSLQNYGWKVLAAGNIGLPCLNLIEKQNELDAIILEVSSFQLEFCQSFAPDLAIWTNFYPNHLDRHQTLEGYFNAKCAIMRNQSTLQHALLPHGIKSQIKQIKPHSKITYIRKTGLEQNKALVKTALKKLTKANVPFDFPALEHRMEHVATINGVTFINDSKSTTPESTLAAINQISAKRILLFLGGLSKGIDRTHLIKKLKNRPIIVFCFGHEAPLLHNLCRQYHISSYQFTNLEYAFKVCMQLAKPEACILFSPAGSSFDLFENYQNRGRFFKKLVSSYWVS